ncbi:MAG: Beta-galactosidase C-terminal domain, partial [Clostridia bacterium]|nr:Beta-galactosidase C-terminal domain [Clostridia bacterium]
ATYPWGREDNELIEWYKFLGGLRQNYSAFTCGEIKEICVSNGFYCYSRSDDNSEVLIAVNVGEKEYCFEFGGILLDLIKNECYKGEINIKPYSMNVLICEP